MLIGIYFDALVIRLLCKETHHLNNFTLAERHTNSLAEIRISITVLIPSSFTQELRRAFHHNLAAAVE
jgi:hypothetical protein